MNLYPDSSQRVGRVTPGRRFRTLQRVMHNPWLHGIMGILISGGLAYIALNTLSWQEVIDSFQKFPVVYGVVSLIPLVGAMFLRSARWWVLIPGNPVSFPSVLVTQNAGIGLNNLLPVRIGSEAFQLALITRHYRLPLPLAISSLVGGNVLDIFATGIMMGIGVVLVPGLRETNISIQLFGAVVMLAVSLLALIGVSRGLHAIPIANRFEFFHRVIWAVNDLRDRPFSLLLSFIATLSHWLLMGICGWILAVGFGLPIDPLTMATVLVAATFFTSAMISVPGGVGTFHFAVISMLTALGCDPEAVFGFAVIMHLLTFMPPIAVAFGVTLRIGSAVLGNRVR